jgi:predicted transcriptional regulator
MSDKKKLMDAVKAMPDQASWDEIVDELTIMAALDKSFAEADAGLLNSHAEVMKRFHKKCASASK